MTCKIHDSGKTDKKAPESTKAMDEENKENKQQNKGGYLICRASLKQTSNY